MERKQGMCGLEPEEPRSQREIFMREIRGLMPPYIIRKHRCPVPAPFHIWKDGSWPGDTGLLHAGGMVGFG